MDTKYIISKSLQNYDSVSDTINFLKSNTVVFKERQNDRILCTVSDLSTNKIILKTEVEYLGVYNTKLKIWCWGWSLPVLRTIDTELSKKMLLYALDLGPESAYLKSILITSRGTLVDSIQLDIHVALASYILKQPYIYPHAQPIDNYDLIYYYIMLNTEDIEKLNIV